VPLLLLLLQRILIACCPRRIPSGLSLPALLQKANYANYYARASMFVNIGIVFCCIAPVSLILVIAWLSLISIVWSHNLVSIQRPLQGRGFDAGGAFWPAAVRLQGYALLTSQFLLASILALNGLIYTALILVLLLMSTTRLACLSLEAKFAPIAASMALVDSAAVDTTELQAPAYLPPTDAAAAAAPLSMSASAEGAAASACSSGTGAASLQLSKMLEQYALSYACAGQEPGDVSASQGRRRRPLLGPNAQRN